MKNWLGLNFLYLIIVALLGTVLRWFFIAPPAGWRFDFLLHAHSHLAMLGWIFNLLFVGLLYSFVPDKIRGYRVLFWLLQLAVLGMLFSFPFQGYAAVSIAFTSLHVFLSWGFAWRFWRDIKGRKGVELQFARWAVVFMVVSSIGPFALGAAMAQGDSMSVFGKLALYFYLHFQYNGWFIFGCLALLFSMLKRQNIPFSTRHARKFLWLMVFSCIAGYALSALWFPAPPLVVTAAISAATVQVGALYFLWQALKPALEAVRKLFVGFARLFLSLSVLAFVLKVIMQAISAFPGVGLYIGQSRNLAIGYLHLVFLGAVTLFLLAWYSQANLMKFRARSAKVGLLVFLAGFIATELLIFLPPVLQFLEIPMFYSYHRWLFGFTVFMPVGLIMAFAKMKFEGVPSKSSPGVKED